MEGVPVTDITGTRLFGLIDYEGVDNRLESADGSIVLALSDGAATSEYNWRKGSGVGTDIGYSVIAFAERHIAYMKNFAPESPIVSIEGIATEVFANADITLSSGRGMLSARNDHFRIYPSDSFAGDLVISYAVQTDSGEEARQFTIPDQTIENWRNETTSHEQDQGLPWASPEPVQEGFCVYEYETKLSKCHKFEDYSVVTTDLVSFWSTNFDARAVYQEINWNAYPGVRTIVISGDDVRVFFKDTSDNQYYEAVADLDEFSSLGGVAITYTAAVNEVGEANIMAGVTSLEPLSTLALTDVTLTETSLQEFTIDFGQPLSKYAALPRFEIWNGTQTVPLARADEWSTFRDTVTLHATAQGLINNTEHEVRLLDPIFIVDSTRRYEFAETLTVTPSGQNEFRLAGTSIQLNDYDPAMQTGITNNLNVIVADGSMSIDLRGAPLNLPNMSNANTGGNFKTPTLSFALDGLPVGEGEATVAISLVDGVDNIRRDGERQISVELSVDWMSDGVNASITVPKQTVMPFYITSAGTQVELEVDNFDADLLSVTRAGIGYPATLDLKLLSALSKVDAVSPSSLLRAGIFHIKITTNLPISDFDGNQISELIAIIEVGSE